jgi:membrane protein DedA with SNARE-associated domain
MSIARVVAAVASVVLLCLAVWRLKTGRRGRAALGAGAALVLALYAGGGGLALPEGDTAVEDAGDALGAWTYPFVGLMAFLETSIPPVTFVFPGEFAVLLGGAIAGEGRVEIVPLVALVWACSAAGDSVTWVLGRRLGRPFLVRHGPSFGLVERRLERLDRWFDRYGGPALSVGRLLPLARPLGPFIAGSSHFPYKRFLGWNLLGTLLFALAFCLLGYAFYSSYDELSSTVARVAFGVLVAIVATLLVARRLRGPRLKERTP